MDYQNRKQGSAMLLLGNFTERPFRSIDDLSISAAFKIVWAGLLQLYTATERKKASVTQIKAALSDTSFAKGGQIAVLCLEQGKTHTEHTRLQTLLAITGGSQSAQLLY